MKEKKITMTAATQDGQPKPIEVGLAYCFATEIIYKDLSGEDITDFMAEAVTALGSDTPRMPDVKKSIYAILSAVMAYSQAKGDVAPIKDTDLMNHCTPQDIGLALGTVIGLRSQFYALPAGEPEDKKEKGGKKRKNA